MEIAIKNQFKYDVGRGSQPAFVRGNIMTHAKIIIPRYLNILIQYPHIFSLKPSLYKKYGFHTMTINSELIPIPSTTPSTP